MNADQIRKALKPMADFAPAVLAAADIIEAAEEAERKIPVCEQNKKAIEQQIADLNASLPSLQTRVNDVRKQLVDAQRSLQNVEQERNAIVADVAEKRKVADQNHAAHLATQAEELRAAQALVRDERAALEQVRSDLRGVKKAIPV